MKKFKTLVSVILAVIIVASISVCAFAAEAITEAGAKEIALNHAGIAAADATFTKAKLDWEDGIKVYEIEFYSGVTEYDYDINAATGAVVSYESEIDDDRFVAPQTPSAPEAGNYIGIENAKQAALGHAGLAASDVSFIKAKLDYDNGAAEYDVDFIAGNYEYDYEINAVTGAVISWDKEIEFNSVPSAPAAPAAGESTTPAAPAAADKAKPEYIGADKAKEIALNHAEKTASEVKFTKAKLDYDDGIAHYDIEFRAGANEYDYEINAVTGAIVEYDFDIEPVRTGSFFTRIANFFSRLFGGWR